MGWTDNCGLQGLVQADAIDSTEGAECEDTVVARAYEGPDDQCGNKLADYEASFTITKPDASYVLSAASSTLECGSKLDWEVTKTLCSETALFQMGKAAVETTCGMKEVEITYQPTCGIPIIGKLDVVVKDTIMPVFDCIASGSCPPISATVCELPSPFELCATDACQGKLCDTPDPIAVGCEGGNFEYQWQVTEPGCNKLASSMLKASYTLPSRTPSFVAYAGKQTQVCDPKALPIVCAQVPACSGVDKDYSAYIECSNNDIGNQGVFVFGQVDQSGACNGVYRVNVTYTSTHGCKVTKSVEYASGCCCDTAFAVFDINHPSGDDSQCFIDDPLQTDSSKLPRGGFNRWGWTIGPVASGYEGTHDVYAGAGQCNLVNGDKVGTAHIRYFGGTVMVTMVASGPQNSRFTSSHVYIGTNPYPTVANKYTVAPGQYGNVRTHDPAATTFVVTKTGLSGPVYVIVHWDSVYACIAA